VGFIIVVGEMSAIFRGGETCGLGQEIEEYEKVAV